MRWQVTILLAGVFFHGKLRPMKKTPREDVHSREAETCRKRPRETPECAKAHSFLCGMHSKIMHLENISKPIYTASKN